MESTSELEPARVVDLGRQVIEDLARAALPEAGTATEQPDPTGPAPRDGEDPEVSGR